MKILKFSATWCAPCKALTPVLDKVLQGFPDIEVQEVDIEKDPELVYHYHVRGVPTLVLLDQTGKVLGMSTGTTTESAVRRFLESHR